VPVLDACDEPKSTTARTGCDESPAPTDVSTIAIDRAVIVTLLPKEIGEVQVQMSLLLETVKERPLRVTLA
jgi:hypothetical protein